MRAALDANLPVCAEGFGDGERVKSTRDHVEHLSDTDIAEEWCRDLAV